jgi:hypothetical protein
VALVAATAVILVAAEVVVMDLQEETMVASVVVVAVADTIWATINAPSVKFVRREAIWPIDAGTCLKKIMFPMIEQLLRHENRNVTPTGIQTQELRITLQVI